MSNEITTLYADDWLELRRVRIPERGINGYTYSHEKRCGGAIVAILPYRRHPGGGPIKDFLLRHEVCPCWGLAPVACAITGGCDKPGKSPRDIAAMELYEEAGINYAEDGRWLDLGRCRGTKSTDTTFFLFAVEVSGVHRTNAPGDGSRLEADAWCEWHPGRGIAESCDPLLHVLLTRLETQIGSPWRR